MLASNYIEASRKIARLHVGDADLVRPGAKKHGVNVVEGGLFMRMSAGDRYPKN